MFISSAYAQTAAPASGSGGILGFLPLLVMIGVLYFLMIRPQIKRQKELKTLLESLNKGDEVVTTGGVLGKITKLNETIVTLEIAPNTEVQLQRSAIVQVLPKGSIKAS